MFNHRRFAASVLLAAGLGAGTVTVAGCGGSPPAAAPATTSAAPSVTATPSQQKQPKISVTALGNVAHCVQAHGVAIPADEARVNAKEIKDVFRALPLAKQHSVFAACGPLLPAAVRQVVQERMAEETGGTTP